MKFLRLTIQLKPGAIFISAAILLNSLGTPIFGYFPYEIDQREHNQGNKRSTDQIANEESTQQGVTSLPQENSRRQAPEENTGSLIGSLTSKLCSPSAAGEEKTSLLSQFGSHDTNQSGNESDKRLDLGSWNNGKREGTVAISLSSLNEDVKQKVSDQLDDPNASEDTMVRISFKYDEKAKGSEIQIGHVEKLPQKEGNAIPKTDSIQKQLGETENQSVGQTPPVQNNAKSDLVDKTASSPVSIKSEPSFLSALIIKAEATPLTNDIRIAVSGLVDKVASYIRPTNETENQMPPTSQPVMRTSESENRANPTTQKPSQQSQEPKVFMTEKTPQLRGGLYPVFEKTYIDMPRQDKSTGQETAKPSVSGDGVVRKQNAPVSDVSERQVGEMSEIKTEPAESDAAKPSQTNNVAKPSQQNHEPMLYVIEKTPQLRGGLYPIFEKKYIEMPNHDTPSAQQTAKPALAGEGIVGREQNAPVSQISEGRVESQKVIITEKLGVSGGNNIKMEFGSVTNPRGDMVHIDQQTGLPQANSPSGMNAQPNFGTINPTEKPILMAGFVTPVTPTNANPGSNPRSRESLGTKMESGSANLLMTFPEANLQTPVITREILPANQGPLTPQTAEPKFQSPAQKTQQEYTGKNGEKMLKVTEKSESVSFEPNKLMPGDGKVKTETKRDSFYQRQEDKWILTKQVTTVTDNGKVTSLDSKQFFANGYVHETSQIYGDGSYSTEKITVLNNGQAEKYTKTTGGQEFVDYGQVGTDHKSITWNNKPKEVTFDPLWQPSFGLSERNSIPLSFMNPIKESDLNYYMAKATVKGIAAGVMAAYALPVAAAAGLSWGAFGLSGLGDLVSSKPMSFLTRWATPSVVLKETLDGFISGFTLGPILGKFGFKPTSGAGAAVANTAPALGEQAVQALARAGMGELGQKAIGTLVEALAGVGIFTTVGTVASGIGVSIAKSLGASESTQEKVGEIISTAVMFLVPQARSAATGTPSMKKGSEVSQKTFGDVTKPPESSHSSRMPTTEFNPNQMEKAEAARTSDSLQKENTAPKQESAEMKDSDNNKAPKGKVPELPSASELNAMGPEKALQKIKDFHDRLNAAIPGANNQLKYFCDRHGSIEWGYRLIKNENGQTRVVFDLAKPGSGAGGGSSGYGGYSGTPESIKLMESAVGPGEIIVGEGHTHIGNTPLSHQDFDGAISHVRKFVFIPGAPEAGIPPQHLEYTSVYTSKGNKTEMASQGWKEHDNNYEAGKDYYRPITNEGTRVDWDDFDSYHFTRPVDQSLFH